MNWNKIASGVADIVSAAEPFVSAAFPGASAALSIAEKILQGVIAAEPTAVALYERITSGEVPTPDELQKYAAAYEASYQKLKADLAAKIAALPA